MGAMSAMEFDAVSALKNLGFKAFAAKEAVAMAIARRGGRQLEEIVKEALKLASPATRPKKGEMQEEVMSEKSNGNGKPQGCQWCHLKGRGFVPATWKIDDDLYCDACKVSEGFSVDDGTRLAVIHTETPPYLRDDARERTQAIQRGEQFLKSKAPAKSQEEKKMSERLCQNDACKKPLPADAHGRTRYCSPACKAAGNNANQKGQSAPTSRAAKPRAVKAKKASSNGNGHGDLVMIEVPASWLDRWFSELPADQKAQIYEEALSN